MFNTHKHLIVCLKQISDKVRVKDLLLTQCCFYDHLFVMQTNDGETIIYGLPFATIG